MTGKGNAAPAGTKGGIKKKSKQRKPYHAKGAASTREMRDAAMLAIRVDALMRAELRRQTAIAMRADELMLAALARGCL